MTVVIFMLLFSCLILVHELGHFLFAKLMRVKVEEFGLGLPPRIRKIFRVWGTDFTVNWLPLGGFVRLFGEGQISTQMLQDPRSFVGASVGRRFLIIIGGVVFNWLFAWLLILGVFLMGFRPLAVLPDDLIAYDSYLTPTVSFAKEVGLLEKDTALRGLLVMKVVKNSVAERLQLVAGDRILKINGHNITDVAVLNRVLVNSSLLAMQYMRGTKLLRVTGEYRGGQLGVVVQRNYKLVVRSFPFQEAVYLSGVELWQQTLITVSLIKGVFKQLLMQARVPDGIMGPVGIAAVTGTFVAQGFVATMIFMAIISISLAVMNILPVPALDGGRLVFLIWEVITRRRISSRVENLVHGVGFVGLMLLMILVTYYDIIRLF